MWALARSRPASPTRENPPGKQRPTATRQACGRPRSDKGVVAVLAERNRGRTGVLGVRGLPAVDFRLHREIFQLAAAVRAAATLSAPECAVTNALRCFCRYRQIF
jgi:hypothetical protein